MSNRTSIEQTSTGRASQERTLASLPEADILIAPATEGKRRLSIRAKTRDLFINRRSVTTAYPDPLILQILAVKGPGHVCDEIARDEDPGYVASALTMDLLAFFEPSDFSGKRVLDFGCGSGASTMALHRLLEDAEISGVELDEKLLGIARARAALYGFPPDRLKLSLDGETLPAGLGEFDFVVLSAVWEHLLPKERVTVLRQIWSLLKPGGHFFMNQTPHRFTPVEMHTTGLPLINYLPDSLTCAAARAFSKRIKSDESWESLLRRGIRGGTENEVIGLLRKLDPGKARLLPLIERDGVRDRIDLWHIASSEARWPAVKKCMWAFFKSVKLVSGAQIVPSLTLVIQKRP